jgi:hypothetical protein
LPDHLSGLLPLDRESVPISYIDCDERIFFYSMTYLDDGHRTLTCPGEKSIHANRSFLRHEFDDAIRVLLIFCSVKLPKCICYFV